ncbi:MAG: hypothetical protein ACKOKG_14305, partial [Verrucomicrobiota bacterium]
MNRTLVSALLAAAVALLLGGCSTQATYVDPAGTRTLSNVGEINVQDWNMAAEAMVNSLIAKHINSGNLKGSGPEGRA